MRGRSSAKFATPEDEGVLEQTTSLEIRKESGDRTVDFSGVLGVALIEVSVLVPLYHAVAVRDLYKAYAAFEEAPSHETLATKVLGNGIIHAI